METPKLIIEWDGDTPTKAMCSVCRAIFRPLMKAAVHLDQFAEVRFAFSSPTIRFAPSLSLPQSGLLHPAPQPLDRHRPSVVAG